MDDLISRREAIDGFWQLDIEIRPSAIDAITNMLRNLPSATKNRLQHAIDGMNEEEIYDFLNWLMFEYAKQYTDSRSAVIKWLKEGGAE